MTRPEILFPLFAELTSLDGVGPKTAQLLGRVDVSHPVHLLLTLPTGGVDRRLRPSVRGVPLPAVVTVEIEVGLHQPPTARGRPYRIQVRDALTEFQLFFFHAKEDWLRRQLPVGARRIVSGRVELFDGLARMTHPDHVLLPGEEMPDYEPVYPLTEGLTLRSMTRAVREALARAPVLPEWIEPSLLRARGWPTWHEALREAHAPQDQADLSPAALARERLAYDEFLAHQLTLALARAHMRRPRALPRAATAACVTACWPPCPTL